MGTAAKSQNQALIVALCGGLLVIAAFLAVAVFCGEGGRLAAPQGDTLMYMQYARAIAEGHPYRFTPDAARSTGSTSHLYPFLLAVPYRLGARGDALIGAGFALNALFYLASIAAAWAIARRLAAAAAGFGLALVLLSGQFAYTMLGQTDMGLFTALALAVFAAALYGRTLPMAAALALCVWTRPEGSVMAGVMLAAGLCAWRSDPQGPRFALAGAWGCLNAAAMLAVNRMLTGQFMFHSLLLKGHFNQYPLAGAVARTVSDLGAMVLGLLFGVAHNGRQLYALPVIAGALALAGMVSRLSSAERETRLAECWWVLAALGAVGLTAVGGWQGYLFDRHLGWIMPVWLIYIAAGLAFLDRLWGRALNRFLLGIALAAYQAVTLPFFLAEYADGALRTTGEVEFVKAVHAQRPPDESVGVLNYPGLAYYMPGRSLSHLGGYVSPQFAAAASAVFNVEILKHHPAQRFDAWLVSRYEAALPIAREFLGERIAGDDRSFPAAGRLAWYRADWSSLDAALVPASPEAAAAVRDMELVDRLDVGHAGSEAAHEYAIFDLLRNARIEPVVASRPTGEGRLTDVGRVVLGEESFALHATAGRDVRMVLRTLGSVPAVACHHDHVAVMQTLAFRSPLRLMVLADGREIGLIERDLAEGDRFSEIVIDIHGSALEGKAPRITVVGDHVSFAYWFYQ